MALEPSLSICFVENCKKLRFKDNTGTYSATNTGGWGAPNITLASVDEATLSITLPEATTAEDIDVTAVVTAATIVDGLFTLGTFEPEDVDSSETSWPDGIYNITYTITESDIDYTYTAKTANVCQIRCCLEKLKTKFQKWSCNSCDYEKNMMTYYKTKTLLESALYAFGCGDDDEFNNHLTALQKICTTNECDC